MSRAKLNFEQVLIIGVVILLGTGRAAHAQSDALDASLPPPVRNSNGAGVGAFIPSPALNNTSRGARINRSLSNIEDSLFAPPDPMRNRDRFADNPQLDADGVRHFANGKHFDLKTISLDEAIDVTNSSTLGMVKRNNGNANQAGKQFGNQFNSQPPNQYRNRYSAQMSGQYPSQYPNQFGNQFGNQYPGQNRYQNQNQFDTTCGVQNLQQNDMDQARQLRRQQRLDQKSRAMMSNQ